MRTLTKAIYMVQHAKKNTRHTTTTRGDTALKKETMCKLENLIILQYTSNICYTTVTPLDINNLPKEVLSVDTSNGTWKMVPSTSQKTLRIRHDMRRCEDGCRGGVIGIYDRTNIEHLNSMPHAAKDATRETLSCVD